MFQTGTLRAADIFTRREKANNVKIGAWCSLNHLAEADANGEGVTF